MYVIWTYLRLILDLTLSPWTFLCFNLELTLRLLDIGRSVKSGWILRNPHLKNASCMLGPGPTCLLAGPKSLNSKDILYLPF